MSIYDLSALRITEEIDNAGTGGILGDFLGPDVLLVPVPRSAPLRQPDAFWPARQICDALVEANLAGGSSPLLERVRAVPKSSFSARGERPKPRTHFESLLVTADLTDDPPRVTVVDDVVSKGATLIACASRLAERFPEAEILGFALLRTRGVRPSPEDTPFDPISGRIRYDHRNDEANRDDF